MILGIFILIALSILCIGFVNASENQSDIPKKKVPHIFIPSGFFGPDGLKSNWLNLSRFKGL
jgi:hypothetical protein